MTSRHGGARSRNRSPGSSSSSASASPSSVPALNFTLYGAPAPRSAHRTSSGAAKAKPRRRCTKPTPPPPASPMSSCSTVDLRLDLSSVTGEDAETIICDESQVYYSEEGVTDALHGDALFELSSNTGERSYINSNQKVSEEGISKEHSSEDSCVRKTQASEACNIENEDNTLINSSSNNHRSLGSEQDIENQSCSDIEPSSQGFSYLTEESYSDSARSCVSNSSSYCTISEYSTDSYSSSNNTSNVSSPSRNSNIPHNYSNKLNMSKSINKDIPNREVPSMKIGNGAKSFSSPRKRLSNHASERYAIKVQNENYFIQEGEGDRNKRTTQQSSIEIVSICSKDVELEIKKCPDESLKSYLTDCIEGQCKNDNSSSKTGEREVFCSAIKKPSFQQSKEKNDKDVSNDSNCRVVRFQADGSQDESEGLNSSPEFHDYFSFSKGHETPSEEWTIEEETTDEMCLYCARNVNTCVCLPNGNDYEQYDGELTNRSITVSDFGTPSATCSRRGSKIDYQCSETALGGGASAQTSSVGECSRSTISSGLNSRSTGNSVSSTSFEDDRNLKERAFNTCDKYVRCLGVNVEMRRHAYSAPIRTRAPNRVRSSSVLTCDCNSGRRTRFLLERLESGYFSDVPVPDIPLSAGEVMEAVLYARQLVCVLERALDRALSFGTCCDNNYSSSRKTTSRSSNVRERKRSNSLSPNFLRRCDDAKPEVIGSYKDNGIDDVETGTDVRRTRLDNSLQSEVQTCTDRHRHHHKDSCCVPLLSLSPEELQKQRSLLKPAADRRLHDAVAKVLDMADILKSAITRRRNVVDPSDEITCGTNRSISEWSLEES
ncbi:serine-rich adhesin for platelets-like [Periplaneta americana]|uniref:serine-rich adhesin for platelets-like n=1 Tax=Periplaneta americana TaxID=6978 RepID=UPI0037E7015C